jgi:monoamine oxidase
MPAPKSKKKAIRVRVQGDTPLAPPSEAGDRAALLTVAQEFQQLVAEAMNGSGVSPQEQLLAFRRAQSGKKILARPAKRLLERSYAVADLLSYWQKNKRYTDKIGAPRVLPIHGKGATLESLARRFVPEMRVSDVVTSIVRHGEVVRLKDNKVALVGTIVLLTPKTPELTLATITLAAQRLVRCILHNTALPEGQKGAGHFQRYAMGDLTPIEFTQWLFESRPALQKQIMASESSLRLADSRRRKGKTSGVGMFVFRDE